MKRINNVLRLACYALVGIIIVVILREVIGRYLFNSPTRWGLEMTALIQVLFGALGAAYVLQEEGHVSVTMIIDMMADRRRNCLQFITSIIGAILSGVITYQLIMIGLFTLAKNQVTPNAAFPIGPFQLILAAGYAMLSVQFILRGKKFWYTIRRTRYQ